MIENLSLPVVKKRTLHFEKLALSFYFFIRLKLDFDVATHFYLSIFDPELPTLFCHLLDCK